MRPRRRRPSTSFGRNIVLSFRSIFIGPLGLRAGWSVAMFASILAIGLLEFGDLILLGSLAPGGSEGRRPAPHRHAVVVQADEGGLARDPDLRRHVRDGENRGPQTLVLWTGRGTRSTAPVGDGFVAGFHVFLDPRRTPGPSATASSLRRISAEAAAAILGFAFYWTVVIFWWAFVEETLFRGYLQYTLARGIGFWPAAVCCSVVFGFAHAPNPGENVIGITSIILRSASSSAFA